MKDKSSIRRVISQYLGNNVEDIPVPWMDYVDKKTKPLPGSEKSVQTVINMIPKKKPLEESIPGNPDLGPSLMDGVNDGLSRGKEQDNAPANYNDSYRSDGDSLKFHTEFNRWNRSEEPSGSLRWWWKTRERQDDATGNPWGSNLQGLNGDYFTRQAHIKQASKTFNEILDSDKHFRSSKVKEKSRLLKPNDVSTETEKVKGLWTFKIPGDGEVRTVRLQFLQPDEPKDHLVDHPVNVACDCEYFLYWGPQYYAVKEKYMHMPMFRPQLVEPRSTQNGGKGKDARYCKHLYAVASHMLDMNLDENYSKELKDNLLKVTDPMVDGLDPEISDVDLGRISEFQSFLENEDKHKDFVRDALKFLKGKDIDEHQMIDFAKNIFIPMQPESQKRLLASLHKSPLLIVLALIEYKKEKGSVPRYLVSTSYNLLNK